MSLKKKKPAKNTEKRRWNIPCYNEGKHSVMKPK